MSKVTLTALLRAMVDLRVRHRNSGSTENFSEQNQTFLPLNRFRN